MHLRWRQSSVSCFSTSRPVESTRILRQLSEAFGDPRNLPPCATILLNSELLEQRNQPNLRQKVSSQHLEIGFQGSGRLDGLQDRNDISSGGSERLQPANELFHGRSF